MFTKFIKLVPTSIGLFPNNNLNTMEGDIMILIHTWGGRKMKGEMEGEMEGERRRYNDFNTYTYILLYLSIVRTRC